MGMGFLKPCAPTVRLYVSARAIHLDLPMTRGELSQAIIETLARQERGDCMLRIAVSRGAQTAGLNIQADTAPTLVITAGPHQPPPMDWYQNGVRVALVPGSTHRIGGLDRQIKSSNYLSHILIRHEAVNRGFQEAVLMDGDNRVTEGTTSNIFIIHKGHLLTPPPGPCVLAGITREVVLELARKNGIPCTEVDLSAEQIFQADEVFLTNTGIELVPVSHADGQLIADGRPGPLTRSLHRLFLKNIEAGF
jgi:branched-chain amino acid aminotransferase